MLKLIHNVIAIAILAIPAALASAQSTNPEDSTYRGPVAQDEGIAPAASHATASATFRVVVNPEDSGYIGPVAREDSLQAMAPDALHATASATFRVVVNPEDSGYTGPVAQENTTAAPADVARSTFAQRMGQ